MKPLFVCLFFSFLLTFTADMAAQEVKQNTAKMPPKSVASGGGATTAAPLSAPKPAVAKKAKKSVKPASKGLFDDDYDGEVGIKYIGTEPASDEELARVKEVERNAKAAKAAKKTQKPAVTPAPRAEKAKVTDVNTEVIPIAADAKIEVKIAEKTGTVDTQTATEAVEKVKVTEVKAEPKSVESTSVSEIRHEQVEIKPTPKPAIKSASKSAVRGARMEFDAITIDLGNIKEDAILERYFEFTNTGSSNLEILECRGSCGCIQPTAESKIVAAGERGRIYVKYVARNKVGPQKPVVTLTTNGVPSVMRLFIETWVEQIPGGVKDPTPAPAKSENN